MRYLPHFAAALVSAVILYVGIWMNVSASAATPKITWADTTWNVFSSTGNLGQTWNPNRVKIDPDTGRLLEIAKYASAGGVGDPTKYLYGHWVSKLRMSPGMGSKYAVMLIGSNGGQEIDFAENRNYDLDPNRQELTASVHYGGTLTDRFSIPVDMTKFHQVGVIWESDMITFKVDGKVWWTVTDHQDPKGRWRRVSSFGPMHAAIQTNKYGPGPRSVLEVSYFRHTA